MSHVVEGDVVRAPDAHVLETTRVGEFVHWLAEHRDVHVATHDELWRWSVSDIEGFWSAVWEFFGVISHAEPSAVLTSREMPGARWFPGALLNYAENALAGWDDDPDRVAVIAHSQTRAEQRLTASELQGQVARLQKTLRDMGVRRGDRVAGYLPNTPEAVVAYLATASLGAVWASCAAEFGVRSTVDRLAQIEPVVLVAAGGYRYGDKDIDRRDEVAAVRAELPSVRHVIDIEYGDRRVDDASSWSELMAGSAGERPDFEPVPFDQPLVVLFSSGTTGLPKAIVHGHGGIVLEHLKNHVLSWDVRPGDRMLWFTTTAWMMWNALVSGLLVGATLVLVDGNPLFPDLEWQWRLAAGSRATIMGASPGFLMACRRVGVRIADHDLSALRTIGCAGAPLPPEGYGWVREQFGPSLLLNVGSGGTDVCSGLVQNSPMLPVVAGRISGRCLGVDAHAWDDAGSPVVDELGELVITSPMPSMPVGFWGDDDGSRMRAAYFDHFPGVWRHGDWVVFHEDGTCRVAGRSDATLNRGGVRLGTAEFYAVVEELDAVADSLVVHLEDDKGGPGRLILFVVPTAGAVLDDELHAAVAAQLRRALSPRHVPDEIVAVPAVPRNLTGKKLELPVKRVLQGVPVARVVDRDALASPEAMDWFVDYSNGGAR